MLATTFKTKSILPQESVDCPFFAAPDVVADDCVPLRTRAMEKLLKSLDENQATGPDQIPALILKTLADVMAFPFTKVCRRLLDEACWPSLWQLHHICPLFKKGSAFVPGNYRGIHLTCILSKTAERFIGKQLISHLQNGHFGPNQWAFTPGLSARDLVTALVMQWILEICFGKKMQRILVIFQALLIGSSHLS